MKKKDITIKICSGCGVVLQSDNEEEKGYIPKEKYDTSDMCQRCFKLVHYNKRVQFMPNANNDEIIKKVNKLQTYVYFISDFFNISNEVIKTFKSIKVLKTFVISKSDLIPKSISKEKIKNKLREIYDINDDIVFISNKDNNYSFIDKDLEKHVLKSCHILGYTNSGKSTFINKLCGSKITSSNMPNTTLDFLEVMYNNYHVFDTPGFTLTKVFYDINDNNLIKRLNPKYYIKPRVYQTKNNQIYNIEDKLYLNFGNNNVIFYMSNLIKIKKLYKKENIKYKEIKVDSNTDIVIPSLGFINVKKECVICINMDMYKLIEIRNSIF